MLADDDLRRAVGRLPRGWTGHYLARTASTQDQAREAARAGAPSRSVFVADFQSRGRGRQGRRWLASPGMALMLSVLLREHHQAPRPWRSTALAAVALTEAVERVAPSLRPAIKWPNDLLVSDRKVAGILAESAWDGRQLSIIVGIGVNVATTAAELASLGTPATSLELAAGHAVSRTQSSISSPR